MDGCDSEFSKDNVKSLKVSKQCKETQIARGRKGKGDKWSGNRRLMSPSHVIPDVKELMELESS